jgi:hypothetical protein
VQGKKRYVPMVAVLFAILLGAASAAAAAPSRANQAAASDPQVPSGFAAAAAATCEWPVNITNASLQTKTITSSTPRNYASTAWTNLDCGALTVTVPAGMRGGLVVRTDAELTCTGPAEDQTQWCLGRVLVGPSEMFPRELESDGSFAWAQSSPDIGAWESNSFTRSHTLVCPQGTAPCSWTVQVQVRNHTEGLDFRVDGSTVEAQLTYAP